jgi:hypothetical protein
MCARVAEAAPSCCLKFLQGEPLRFLPAASFRGTAGLRSPARAAGVKFLLLHLSVLL